MGFGFEFGFLDLGMVLLVGFGVGLFLDVLLGFLELVLFELGLGVFFGLFFDWLRLLLIGLFGRGVGVLVIMLELFEVVCGELLEVIVVGVLFVF